MTVFLILGIYILFLSSIPWEHHSYSEHTQCHVLPLVYISNSNGLNLVIFMKSTSEGYPDAYPEAALECMAIMPADFSVICCMYLLIGFTDPEILLFHPGSAPLGLQSFPGCLGVVAEQDLPWP